MQQMYPHQPPPQSQPNEWYYDPNIHHQQQQQAPHAVYNNSYNNYKTDFNCLNNQPPAPIHHHPNTDPSLYNGVNYYYPQNPVADPYVTSPLPIPQQQQQQVNHHPQQMDYQHSNYHQNYHSSM